MRVLMNSEETKKLKIFSSPFLIVLIVVLVTGIVIGYGIWGKKEEKLSAKQLLSQIADHIEALEENSKVLQNQIKGMSNKVEEGKKAMQSMEAMSKDLSALGDENKKLRSKMEDYTQLKTQVKELNMLKRENKQMKKTLEEKAFLTEQVKKLKKENEELRLTVKKIKDVVKHPPPPTQPDQPST